MRLTVFYSHSYSHTIIEFDKNAFVLTTSLRTIILLHVRELYTSPV